MLDAVLRSATQRKLSILVGAGASFEAPAASPGWLQFRDEVLAALLEIVLTPSSYDESWVRHVEQLKISHLSPEVLLDAIDRFSGYFAMSLQRNLCSALDLGHPNRTHMSIAALVKCGALRHVFTTNWDSFLERALEPQAPLAVVRGTEELQSGESQAGQSLIYLHGSLRGSYVQGGLWRLGFELASQLQRELLRCAAGQDILVLGYNGADWDILEVLGEAVAHHDTRLFWLHLPEWPVAPGAQQLQRDFPDRVHLLGVDMNEVLAQLCHTLGASPDPVRETATTANIVSARRDRLIGVARELGRYRSCLSLACCAGACGVWTQAWEWCRFAGDIAYDYVSVSPEPLLQRACGAEALRLGAMCLASGGNLEIARFHLRNLRTDLSAWAGPSVETGAMVNYLAEYASAIIHLCSGNLEAAREAVSACGGAIALREYLLMESGIDKHQMSRVSLWQLNALLRVLEEGGAGDAKTMEQDLIYTDLRIRSNRNLSGHCGHLLNVANFYHKWRMRNDAEKALTDCIRESQQYGIRVCENVARQNMRVIEGESPPPSSMLAPVVDRMSGFGLVPDVFCVPLAIRPSLEANPIARENRDQ